MEDVPTTPVPTALINKLGKGIAIVRIAFGLVWLLDAVLKFDPSFYTGMLDIIKSADAGGPTWLNGWYDFWFTFLGSAPHFFAVVVIVIECLLALALLFGIGRKLTYLLGAVFSFLIWGIAEGFGGPYVSGSTDPGAGIIYILVFGLLYIVDTTAIPTRYSLDALLEKRLRTSR